MCQSLHSARWRWPSRLCVLLAQHRSYILFSEGVLGWYVSRNSCLQKDSIESAAIGGCIIIHLHDCSLPACPSHILSDLGTAKVSIYSSASESESIEAEQRC